MNTNTNGGTTADDDIVNASAAIDVNGDTDGKTKFITNAYIFWFNLSLCSCFLSFHSSSLLHIIFFPSNSLYLYFSIHKFRISKTTTNIKTINHKLFLSTLEH